MYENINMGKKSIENSFPLYDTYTLIVIKKNKKNPIKVDNHTEDK